MVVTSSSKTSPCLLTTSSDTTQLRAVSARSLAGKKNHVRFSSLTPTHGSAPNRPENSNNAAISFFGMYFFTSFVVLHSIASLRTRFPAIMSGLGNLAEPEPGVLSAAHPLSQNILRSSLSAAVPFFFIKTAARP